MPRSNAIFCQHHCQPQRRKPSRLGSIDRTASQKNPQRSKRWGVFKNNCVNRTYWLRGQDLLKTLPLVFGYETEADESLEPL